MRPIAPENVRLTTPGMRLMLLIASGLVFIVGIQLYVLTEYTDRFFAWTIKSPLTAAFLGASYWASFAMELLAARKRVWAHARIAVPAVLLFTTLTLIVTLLHLETFHLFAPDPLTRLTAWVWLAVYAIVPLAMGWLLLAQLRVPGIDPPRGAPLATWLRMALLIHALVLLPLGAGLLLLPELVRPLWPWTLTPLTAQAIGAWLLALGVAAAHSASENDWRRVQVATLSYTVFAVLQLGALVRYPGQIAWDRPAALLYLVFMLSVLLIGLYGWWGSMRVRDPDSVTTATAPI